MRALLARGRGAWDGLLVTVFGVAAVLLGRVSVTMRVVHERVVAGLAAAVERPPVVNRGRGRVLGPGHHPAHGILDRVGQIDTLLRLG